MRYKFSVKVKGQRRRAVIAADYFIVKEGVLWLKQERPGTYPLPVQTYAAGEWQDIATVVEVTR